MEPYQQQLLDVLRTALFGGDAGVPADPAQWGPLLELAAEQSVLPLVLDRLIPVARAAGRAGGALAPLRQRAILAAAGQAGRTEALRRICAVLNQAGLRVLVVKGLGCRLLYPKPDLRPSSDEDLLARDQDLEEVHRVLTGAGLETGEADSLGQAQEVTYYDPTSGLRIELHRRLFSEQSRAYGGMNRLFEGAYGRAVPLEGPAWTMCPQDHLLYLICHSFKHFLHSGFGVRQVCDICLYAAAWGDQVDWGALFAALEEFRADCFACNLFDIGGRCLGFDGRWPAAMEEALAAREAPDSQDLLEDLLAGGVYGSSSEERLHSSLITLNAVAGADERASVLRTVFPRAEELKGSYPYLEKHPWMLPGAWAQRLARYAAGGGRRAASARESLSIGEKRVELMKKYRVIP